MPRGVWLALVSVSSLSSRVSGFEGSEGQTGENVAKHLFKRCNIPQSDLCVPRSSGGIVVLDSKWRSSTDADAVAEMTASAKKAAIGAHGLARSMLKSERGAKHRTRAQPVNVEAAVVLWGAAREMVKDGDRAPWGGGL